MKIFIMLFSFILLTGCSNKNCISSHKEKQKCTTYVSYKLGSTYIRQPIVYDCYRIVCDKYEVDNEETR